jgi:hypothetical protein
LPSAEARAGRAWGLSPDDAKPLWTVKVDGDAVGVAASAGTVYVAGHYDYIVDKNSSCYQFCPGGPTRHHLSAFTTGAGLRHLPRDALRRRPPAFPVRLGWGMLTDGEMNS